MTDPEQETLEQRVDELEEAVEMTNDLLAPALEHANTYMSHDKTRPSAKRAFDKLQEAHLVLSRVDPSREEIDE